MQVTQSVLLSALNLHLQCSSSSWVFDIFSDQALKEIYFCSCHFLIQYASWSCYVVEKLMALGQFVLSYFANKRNCHCILHCLVTKHQGENANEQERCWQIPLNKAFVAFPSLSNFCQFNLSVQNRSNDLVQLQPAIIF